MARRDTGSQPNPGNTKTKSDEDESYPKHVYDTLYKVVNKYSKCHCGLPDLSSEIPTRHWGRLELQANFGTSDNEILFHTVFSKRGSCEYDEKIEWQHLQLRVPRHVGPSKYEMPLLTQGIQKTTQDAGGGV